MDTSELVQRLPAAQVQVQALLDFARHCRDHSLGGFTDQSELLDDRRSIAQRFYDGAPLIAERFPPDVVRGVRTGVARTIEVLETVASIDNNVSYQYTLQFLRMVVRCADLASEIQGEFGSAEPLDLMAPSNYDLLARMTARVVGIIDLGEMVAHAAATQSALEQFTDEARTRADQGLSLSGLGRPAPAAHAAQSPTPIDQIPPHPAG